MSQDSDFGGDSPGSEVQPWGWQQLDTAGRNGLCSGEQERCWPSRLRSCCWLGFSLPGVLN